MKASTSIDSIFQILPNELLVEILKHSGWKDIMAMRLTCKHMLRVSRTKAVWVSLFHNLSNEMPVPPALERPLSTYSAGDLENCLMRRISSEVHWSSSKRGWVKVVRDIDAPSDTDCLVLLDGGRWLLSTTDDENENGLIFVVDLHSGFANAEQKVVIDLETGEADRFCIDWRMAADSVRDDNSSYIVCLSPRTAFFPTNSPNLIDATYIYGIDVHGFGETATLQSRKIKVLPGSQTSDDTVNKDVYCCDVMIRGDYLIRYLEVPVLNYRYEIYNWAKSDGVIQFKACIDGLYDPHGPANPDIAITPAGKIVLFTPGSAFAYDATNIEPTPASTRTDQLPIIRPYWVSTLLVFKSRSFLSKSRAVQGAYASRLTAILDTYAFGVTIPDKATELPSFEYMSNMPVPATLGLACTGISKLFFYYYDPRARKSILYTAGLLWEKGKFPDTTFLQFPADGNRYRYRYIGLPPGTWQAKPLFDEGSNRLLLFVDSKWILFGFSANEPAFLKPGS